MAVNWRLKVISAILALAAWAGTAQAGPQGFGEEGNSFGLWVWNTAFTTTAIDMIAVQSTSDPQLTSGIAYKPPDSPFTLLSGWNDAGNSSLRVMTGPSVLNSSPHVRGGAVWSGSPRDVSFDILFFAQGHQSASYGWHVEFDWLGSFGASTFTFGSRTWNPTRDQLLQSIPLPPAFLLGLLGLGGVGAGGFLRRRKMAA